MPVSKGWIGVDLDGVLAYYDKWRGVEHIGVAIPAMLQRVYKWIGEGKTVKIFTARISEPGAEYYIKLWLSNYGLQDLEITNVKDFAMTELWDDRCVQVIPNTGIPVVMATNPFTKGEENASSKEG